MARRLLKISKEETPQPPGSLCQCCHPHRTEVLLVSRGLCLLPPVLPEGTTKKSPLLPSAPSLQLFTATDETSLPCLSRLHSPSSPLLLTAEELQALCHLDGPTCLSYWEPRTGPSTPGAASAAQSRGEEPLLLTRCRYSASHSRESPVIKLLQFRHLAVGSISMLHCSHKLNYTGNKSFIPLIHCQRVSAVQEMLLNALRSPTFNSLS